MISLLKESLLPFLEHIPAGHKARCTPARLDLARVNPGAAGRLEAESGEVRGTITGGEADNML